ncbi:hypothetical protein F750_0632 [Streptomyces sp. PAMC 26508]|nr:hypothetical protein F750_0632 [Streptomyces sp. PAMC 26508]
MPVLAGNSATSECKAIASSPVTGSARDGLAPPLFSVLIRLLESRRTTPQK